MSTDNLDQILAPLTPEQREAYLNRPALDPPPGLESNLDDPPNQNTMIYGVFAFYLLMATVAVALRVYCKFVVARKIQLEDCLQLTTTTGMYVHQWDIRVGDLPVVYYAVNVASSVYAASMGCLKVAILTDWIRTFSPRGARGAFFWACQALMWINIIFYCAALIVGNLTCKPYARIWDKAIPGTCMNRKDLDVSNAILNIISHVAVLILPHAVIWKLNMQWKTKVGVSLVFAVGLFVCVAASLRLVATIRYSRTTDTTYWVCDMAFWCATELAFVVLVFCVPAFPKVLRETKVYSRLLDSWRSWSVRRSRNHDTSKRTASETELTGYERIGDNVISMHDAPHNKAGGIQPHEYTLQPIAHPERILRTTRFETTEEYRDGSSTSKANKYSIPWTN
ncbi:hypothetical protein JX265_010325 [Neoarthrinium moseri]|uniref:Rhodopsin domain-containing protein n=1 Tax=Neoarthrinium moseri TaxID=1658444 RepID=A0A9Q0ALW5_9PEZI|nr:hypothetical protein JX265_010325 [Neoarthrinium moseri]